MILEELCVDLLCKGRSPCSFSMTQKKTKKPQRSYGGVWFASWLIQYCHCVFRLTTVSQLDWIDFRRSRQLSQQQDFIQPSLANAHQGNHIRCGTWIFICFIYLFLSACCTSTISLKVELGHLCIFMGLTQVFYYLEPLLVKQIDQLSGKAIDVGWHIQLFLCWLGWPYLDALSVSRSHCCVNSPKVGSYKVERLQITVPRQSAALKKCCLSH